MKIVILRRQGGITEDLNPGLAGFRRFVVYAYYIESPLAHWFHMAEILPYHEHDLAAFVAVDGALGRLDSQRSAGLNLIKTEDVGVPADQVNFATELGRAEVSRHHDVAETSQVAAGFLSAPASGALVLRDFIGRKSVEGEPVEGADGVTREKAWESCRLGPDI